MGTKKRWVGNKKLVLAYFFPLRNLSETKLSHEAHGTPSSSWFSLQVPGLLFLLAAQIDLEDGETAIVEICFSYCIIIIFKKTVY